MNEYEQKQEDKRQRYLDRAENAETEADRRFDSSRDRVSGIPFGQPILVGHHSEKRHRATLERSNNDMRKGVEASDKAKYYTEKAASVGSGGISSDDPEAVVKLKEKLERREKTQDMMKAANRIIKNKKLDDPAKVEKLAGIGINEKQGGELLKPDFCGRIGFASYQLTNNNANIRRIKERIEALKRAAGAEYRQIEKETYTMTEDPDENRVMFEFDGKPDAEIRTTLKRNGFKWSPSRTAWVRMLNNAGRYAAKNVMELI